MKVMHSLPCKAAAIILSWILLAVSILGTLCFALMAENGLYFYSRDEMKRQLISGLVQSDVNSAIRLMYDTSCADTYGGNDRLQLTIENADGETVYNDYSGGDYIYDFAYGYLKGDVESYEYEIPAEEAEENPECLPKNLDGYTVTYHFESEENYTDEGAPVDTSGADAAGGYYVIRYEAPYEDIVVEAHVMDNTGALDRYGLVMEFADEVYDMRISGPIITGLCAVAFIIIIIYLLCAAGHNGRDGEIHKNFLDKVPFDVHTAAVCAVVCVCIAVGCEAVMSIVMYLVMWCVLASVIYFVLLSYVMSFATRLKAGGIIKGTLIYRGCGLLRKQLKRAGTFAKHVLMSIPGVWQAAIVICAIAVYELIMISLYYDGYRYLMWVIEYIIVIPLAIMAAVSLRRIRNGAKELAGGNIEYQIDTKYIPGCLKNFSADMNSISDGLTSAVEDRMKSERFKTELITNVSHDIKTPLTSIINYVDLIKKEKPENENIRQYIDVLDRQSSRLKKLIEDLVEASKASTGNVSVSMEPCEVGVIIAQTAGEYDEKLKSRQLDLVMNIPEEPCRIMADGRHLWRVLDNLMNNIYKYAQPGTRVYINLERKNGRVSIIFKNISKYELNISSDELLERFTRGDVSRNTEGSGLGLSIANSLTELQGGTLSLTVDGDLFKVILTFDEI